MDEWVALSELVRNGALAIAAGIGAFLAWRKLGPETKQAGTAVVQADLARRAHVMELFNRAAGQLGDDKLEVRLAAIYVLREVGRDFPEFSDPVFELLQVHLEERANTGYGNDEPPADVKAILQALLLRARIS